ncbi:hypothetical protein KW803_02880 [Candidatus Saccharibacteria bacterium]|nr:hypothetical protein [Candidatus Saccharibacteria bacterium]
MPTTDYNQTKVNQPHLLEADTFNPQINDSEHEEANQLAETSTNDESWLLANKFRVAAVGAYLGAVALTYNQLGEVKDQVFESAHWTVPAIVASETIAQAGLAAMVVATGSKVGNPITFKKRIQGFRGKLTNSNMFRTGAYLNLAGAAGTSAVIASEAVAELPQSAWPAALGVAGLSTALSLPFYKVARAKRAEGLGGQE